jgi:hypothetical protein
MNRCYVHDVRADLGDAAALPLPGSASPGDASEAGWPLSRMPPMRKAVQRVLRWPCRGCVIRPFEPRMPADRGKADIPPTGRHAAPATLLRTMRTTYFGYFRRGEHLPHQPSKLEYLNEQPLWTSNAYPAVQ